MAVADALVSKVVDMLTSTINQEFRLVARIDQQARELTSNLQSIQAALVGSVERRQLEDATARLWLDRLKSVAYDIDDALDEWSYKVLESQTESDENSHKLTIKVCYLFYPVFAIGPMIAVEINRLNWRLAVIAAGKDQYISVLLRGVIKRLGIHGTANEIDMVPVLGREVEKARLVNLLLEESNELSKLRRISVVGMVGIGKTTLAKLVYNDEIVKTHFDKGIWICVSGPFNKIRIAKEILESLEDHTLDVVDWQSIVVRIQESFEGKKILLVLDNLWSEDPEEWKQLEDCLIGCSSGSKLLVTTRKEGVAKLLGCNDRDIFKVGLLSTEEYWLLFCEIAFSRRPSEEIEQLERISVKIVARCKGLPLAVKIIAGVLRFKSSTKEWESVLSRDFWKLEEVQQDIFGPSWLSYDDLPSSLKQCFLYCVIFPKGYRMNKDELVSLWMAHGFLKPTQDRDMEMAGHDYFYILHMRSLFQDLEVEEKFNRLDKTYCKMHDIVHDFAKYIMAKECLTVDVNSAEEVTSGVDAAYSDDLYHLHVKLGEKVKFLRSFYNMRKLRSLFISPPKKDSFIGAALPKIFNKLTCLRSLSLSRCRLESIPSNISKLIHLRWLKLSKNYTLKELPETLCDLYHLQTLSVNWCDGLIHFPKRVEKLTNLRHLKNNYTYFLLPKGIGKLSGLRQLLRITIDPKFKDAFSLRDLKNLNNISGSLTIFFIQRERNTLVDDAKQAQLEEKKHITALSLNFPERAAEEWMHQQDEELVEALKPPPGLELLRITCYMGASSPSYINTLTSLKKLKLWYWSNCEHLPALGMLPCLEYVEFNNFGRVKKVSAAFYGMDGVVEASSSTAPLFPKLTNLEFMNMIEWEEWNDYDGDEQVLPCLSYLSIENCPKLKSLPNFIRRKATLQRTLLR